MIEVLVALIVVAFGLLGLAGLQARSMSFQKDSFDRKAATEVAAQLTERVIANYDGFRTGHYNRTMLPAAAVPAAIPACGNALNCTAAEIANRDWAMWQIDLRRRLPVSGAYLVAPANAVELTTDPGLAGRADDRRQSGSDLQRGARQHPGSDLSLRHLGHSPMSIRRSTQRPAACFAAFATRPHADRVADRNGAQPDDRRGGGCAVRRDKSFIAQLGATRQRRRAGPACDVLSG